MLIHILYMHITRICLFYYLCYDYIKNILKIYIRLTSNIFTIVLMPVSKTLIE